VLENIRDKKKGTEEGIEFSECSQSESKRSSKRKEFLDRAVDEPKVISSRNYDVINDI